MKKMIRIFIAGLATVFLTLNVSAQQNPATQKDTFCVSSAGTGNQVIINSKNMTQINDCIDSLTVRGEIVQNGQNNKVAIQIPNNKRQIRNNDQKTKHKNTVIIKQNGKNNSVKINAQ